ncbi:MAG TPA: Ig-like domain-containing protein [Chitinophagaceae bacterium]|jgi:uncharacterized protein (DUF2141 family)|nr:Ig-like domain-containing protein [Chitinophagaceae bacterium]
MKKISFVMATLFVFIVILLMAMGGTGCANIVPPSGGPRDSIPPLLLKTTPGDSTRNFKGNKITFTFDEFIDIDNPGENLLISPSLKTNPVVDHKLNTITLKLKDTLDDNTTYTIQFGRAVKDFNEGNILQNLVYTFSTGPYIDSLQLKGKVILAETGKIDTTLIVMLHTSANDSAVVKERPRYISKLNGQGEFVFTNLPPKTFYIYTLKDNNGTRRYLDEKQLFGFADKPVTLSDSVSPVTLYAYSESDATPNIPASPASGNRNRRGPGDVADKRLKLQTNLVNNQQDLLSPLVISTDKSLRSFDSTKLKLYTDSVFNPVTDCQFVKDSSNKKIVLQFKWKEQTLYHIILDKDFAVDEEGKKLLRNDTISFTTKKLADYGSVKLTIRNVDMSKNPILQFIAGNQLYKSYPLAGNTFSEDLFLPGEYELRILYDENKNGKWDAGKFFGKHQQPEIAKPIERKINIKPAWKNEFDISL